MPSRAEILKYLYSLHRHGIKPGLGRISSILLKLGNPHRDYPSIHVAGTNGKGSTCAMLESVLIRAGHSVGLYTSPHLEKFNERIRVNGIVIPDRDMIRIASVVKKACSGEEPTFFEFTTAMAFVYFRERMVDIAVLEAGMGGRLDATNVVTPLVSVVTNVGLDHMEYLGHGIKKIAREKAGIIKKNVPVVTACEEPEAMGEIAHACERQGSPLYMLGRDFLTRPLGRGKNGEAFDYLGITKNLSGLDLDLRGVHQHKNAACALAAIEIASSSGITVPLRAMKKGLEQARWPARVEVLSKRPLIIIDAAHNPDGARSLREALRGFTYERLILVLGIMADKDIGGILRELAPLAEEVILTAPRTERAANPDILLDKLAPYGKNARAVRPVARACGAALREAGANDAVCVAGSIFTAGEAMKYLKDRLAKKPPRRPG